MNVMVKFDFKKKGKKTTRAHSVPKRSPIQVLTVPDVA